MKHFLIVLSVLLLSLKLKAQTTDVELMTLDIASKPYGDHDSEMIVIKPTVGNFAKLLSLNEVEFEEIMKKYGYFEENSAGKYRAFWNGSLTNFIETKCVNTFNYNIIGNEVRFFLYDDMQYPVDAMSSLYRELKPYYNQSKANSEGNTVDYFVFKGGEYVFQFFITDNGKMFDVVAIRKHISEFENK